MSATKTVIIIKDSAKTIILTTFTVICTAEDAVESITKDAMVVVKDY